MILVTFSLPMLIRDHCLRLLHFHLFLLNAHSLEHFELHSDFQLHFDMVPDRVDFLLVHFQAAVAHRLNVSRDSIRHFHQTGHF